jgi:hypothetical protein
MRRVPLVYNDPRHWQARAAEAREIADGMADPAARASMLAVAEQYDKIAARAVERLKTHAKSVAPLVDDA